MAVHNKSPFVLIFSGGAYKGRGRSKCIEEICLGQDDQFLGTLSS